jgi:hypothetical protein
MRTSEYMLQGFLLLVTNGAEEGLAIIKGILTIRVDQAVNQLSGAVSAVSW